MAVAGVSARRRAARPQPSRPRQSRRRRGGRSARVVPPARSRRVGRSCRGGAPSPTTLADATHCSGAGAREPSPDADPTQPRRTRVQAPQCRRPRRRAEGSPRSRWCGPALAALLVVAGIAWVAYYVWRRARRRARPRGWPTSATGTSSSGSARCSSGWSLAAHPRTPLGRGRGVVVGMLGCFLIGLVWIVVYYVTSQDASVPVIRDLGQLQPARRHRLHGHRVRLRHPAGSDRSPQLWTTPGGVAPVQCRRTAVSPAVDNCLSAVSTAVESPCGQLDDCDSSPQGLSRPGGPETAVTGLDLPAGARLRSGQRPACARDRGDGRQTPTSGRARRPATPCGAAAARRRARVPSTRPPTKPPRWPCQEMNPAPSTVIDDVDGDQRRAAPGRRRGP